MIYDEFQKKAIQVIDEEKSLLVSAPTGAGKTVIAEYAINQALARGEGAIYTAPVKALSNQKFRDFRDQYGDKIGILTGDVSINPDAPVLIMTTEIYRNTLFSAQGGSASGGENSNRLEKIRWVIFDEVHYLDDLERGTVWEEAIMFSPPHLELLCLSATVPNVEEVARWIRTVLNRPIEVIVETHRPVPLVKLFQCQGKILNSTEKLKKQGYLGRQTWPRFGGHQFGGHFLRAMPNRIDKLVSHLQNEKRLPAIYFTFGRRRTERLASELPHFDFLDESERKQIKQMYDELCVQFDLTKEISAQNMKPLIIRGIAFHHAGMLPTLKEVIERLFTSRLLKLIFTTETFALGINMPARSVAFDELRKFYGTHFANLRTRDFYQMAGRAGRRGMDNEGFVYCRINPHQIEFGQVLKMINGKTESIKSQFNATYATLLNLYRTYGEKLFEIYPRSLHHFQNSDQTREKGLDLMKRKCDLLREMNYLNEEGLTTKGEFASCLYGYELVLSEMNERGFLEMMNPTQLNIVLLALIYEPRKNDIAHPLPKRMRDLVHWVDNVLGQVHRRESKHKIKPYTKHPYFHLSMDMEKWSSGVSFDELMRSCETDEGELIRYFRMVIQLLRELKHAPHTSDYVRQTTSKAVVLINRDLVDAEKQLRA